MTRTEDTFEGMGGIRLFAQRWRPEGTPRAVLAIVHGFGEHRSRLWPSFPLAVKLDKAALSRIPEVVSAVEEFLASRFAAAA
jgi:alpha-beta hydrolase superfamily lysophospholipase